ncbi:MAG: filamentous hemagglutinin N-terminal domain-containing protein, partial [Sphingomonadaceae bacterium]|nr:filamentous hemagglutinin N-terminal domain-containing protein [Sphingomonadaceae bacterium]
MVPRSTFDKRRIILAGTSLAALALAGAAHAGPSGGTVSAGSASIAGDGTGRVTVTQTSDRAILDWTGFSIGTGESARFIQPGSTSVAVNRVTGADPSSILGSLTANGRVVLINRNGIAFGKDATVDVGGLVATTADIDRQAFMATGSLNFSGGSLPGASPGASIVNEGRITVRDAGLAALVAPSVRNSGTIVANLGRVALGAGPGFTVDFYGDGLVSVAPDGIVAATVGDGGAALVENSGVIAASGGKVLLSAAAARDVVNASVNVSGVVRADGINREGGSIVLSGSGSVTATGTLSADSAEAEGGRIDISGRAVALGGRVSASGRDGGTVSVAAEGALSLAETVTATGALGSGGGIAYSAGRIVETSTSRSDASGLIDGGTIRSLADGGIVSSGHYAAAGRFGRGGRIDMTGADVSLLSATFDARGRQAGGLVRIGGAFQGGKTPDPSKPYHQSFLGRWGALSGLAKADSVFVSSGSRIDVSASGGAGGTAVIWSEDRTTFLGAIDARGAAGGTTGGAAEISSAGDLRQASLMDVHVGGGHLLLDPKNIVIGNTGDVSGWSYQGVIGAGYFGTGSAGVGLDAVDVFGSSVALNAASDRMAVGAVGDDGAGGISTDNYGAVYLFSFTDGDFSGGTLEGIIGKGYAGGKNRDIDRLETSDQFGRSVSFNAAGNRLAVGASGDDGDGDPGTTDDAGAVYLFSFTDNDFSGGSLGAVMGSGYSGIRDVSIALDAGDEFGTSVSFNAAGDRLAVGAPRDDGHDASGADNYGSVHLFTFTDTDFSDGTLAGSIGLGYETDIVLDTADLFGSAISLNAAGTALAVGTYGDNGAANNTNNPGAVHLFTFSDTGFGGGVLQASIGKDYAGGKNRSLALGIGDWFGYSVALNAAGDRLAIGAVGNDGMDVSPSAGSSPGAVYLYSFTDSLFSGGVLEATLGSGYNDGKDISLSLGATDQFGTSVALNGAGDRLAVGAVGDAGSAGDSINAGAVHLFTFDDTDFSGGGRVGIIGSGYTANKNLNVPIGGGTGAADGFGAAVALNAAADRMAVGAWYDDGFGDSLDGSGAVYLFSFTDGNFSGGALEGVIGHGYGGGNNVDLTGSLEALDNFGHAVALNAAGDRLAVGAVFDDGTDVAALQADNYGAVYLFTFDPDSKFESGEHVGTLGRGYAGPGSFDVVEDGQSFEGLQKTEYFGASLSFDASGNRLAVGASRTPYDTVTDYRGAVYLFSFTDGDFSNPTPEGMIGHGTPGISLDFNDQFGRGIALSAAGDRLAVGANLDDGFDGGQTNAGAVYLFTFDSTGNFQNPEHAMTIGRGYTGAKGFDVGTSVRAGDVLGHSLSFNNDGTLLAVGAPQHDGAGNDSADSGAVYLFDLSSVLAAVDLRTIIGKGYSGRNVPAAIEAGDQFGHAVALSGIGDRMAVGAKDDDGFDNLPPAAGNAGAVHLLALDFSNGLAYGDVAGSLVNVAASDLALQLSLGTNLTLQANNDITVNTAIAVDNEYGDGGDLTLQAGRSILLNAGIATDGGDLTLIANDDLASGVVNAHRDAGNAVITMGASSSINAGAGSVAIEMRTGAGKTNSGSGSITLRGIAAGAVDVSNAGAAGDILLNGNVATTGAQDYMSERDIRVASATTISVSGAETLNMNAAGQIQMLGTASLQNLSTDPTPFDAIVLKANRRTTPDARNLHGIDLGAGSTIVTAAGGGGKIDLSGRSGTGGGYGIMVNGATIQSQGTGSVTLTGEAIGDVGATSSGVIVLSGGSVLSGDGGIVITALATGLADVRPALYLLGAANPAVVKASGTGSVTLSGTRSNGDGEGIWIGVGNSKVETESGDITLVGVGSDKAGGVKTDGVRLGGTGQVFSTAGGDVTVTATSRGTVADFTTLATASLGSAGTGNITINADRAAIAGTSFITGGGVLTIQPRTDGRSIGLGTGAAGDLQLGAGSLGNPLVDGFSEIVIGNSTAGTINVATALLAFKDNLRLVSGANLLFTGTSAGSPLDVGNNRLTLDIAGTTTQSAGLGAYIKAGSLLLTGAGSTYTLTHIGNDIGTLAAGVGTGSVALIHGGSGSLSVGSIGATDGITASSVQLATTNAAADLVLGADVTTSGAQTYTSARNITVDAVDLLVTGKATLGMTAAAQITVLGGTLENAYTGDADSFDAVVLAANDDATPFSSAGSNAAITLKDGARITTASGGGGAIRMTGKAGTGLSDAIGIRIADSTVESPGAGTITIAGTGGAGATGGGKSGVVIGGTTGSRIESSLGDITITGIAGAATSGLANIGVDVAENSTVVSTGNSPDAAGIIVSGTGGGSGGSTLNHGVRLAGALALSSDSGAITVTAAGGSPVSGSDNDGLVLSGTSAVIQSVSGEIVVDAAAGTGGKHLDNLAGSGAVASAGRWIIYLPDPDDTVFGDLASGSLPIWGQTGGTLPPASVGAGNRYVFAFQPTLTASTAFSDDKVYGETFTWPTPVLGTHYDLDGLVDASDYGDVWTQETLTTIGLSGAPVLSSAGAAAGSNVAGSPYDISLANGTLVNTAGYQFGASSSTGTLTVTPKTLTLTGVTAADKDYDGDTDADLSGGTLIGIVGSEDVEFSAGSGSFASKNVGTWTVTASGYALTGGDAGNYTLTQPTVADATITAKALTLTGVTAADKAYDGDTDADLSGGTLVGVVGSDDVDFSAGTGSFASKNVGTWTITASGYVLTGDDAGNYTLTQPTVADASISAKTLTLTGVTASGKDNYEDHNSDLEAAAVVGVISGDDVEFIAGSGLFASKNAGTWSVTASGYALGGGDAGNYTLTQPTVADATITAKALTLTGVTASGKDYDGDADADLSGGTLVGIVGSDDVEFSAGTGAFASKNVGTWTVTASGYALTGDDAGNYTLTQPTVADATITAKMLALTGVTATDKDYDGDGDANLSGGTLAGVIGSDDVGFSAGTGSFASKNVGTWAVTASGYTLTGGDAGNYTLTQPAVADAAITAKALTLTGVTALDRDYDGGADADLSGGTLAGIVSGDDVGFSSGSGSFASRNVGTWSVTAAGYALTGGDAGNYTLAQPVVADATITAKTLTLIGVAAAGKDYDGDADANLSGGTLAGIVVGDDVGFSAGTGSFASKNVGTWSVTASGYALTGGDAGNYTLTQPAVASATVTAKALTLTGVAAADKDYDGDDAADLSGGALVGVIGSDDVSFTGGTGAFASKNAGTWAVTASGYALTGGNAGNYTLAQPAVAAATITAKTLTLTGVAAADKAYDGTTGADLSGGALVGVIGSDDVDFSAGSGTFASKNAGTWSVTVTGYTLTGDDAGNYALTQPTVADATITPRTLNAGVAALDKVYDGTRDAALAFSTGDIVDGDTVAFDYEARFADRNAGTDKTVSLTGGVTLTGTDAANYTLAIDPDALSGLTA